MSRFWRVMAAALLLLMCGGPAGAAESAGRAAPAVPDPSLPGPYAVGQTDVQVSAAGRSYSARVWYPATAAGTDVPVAPGAHPAIAFGHGFFQDVGKYATTLRHWSGWGFITVAPKSQGGLFPSHTAFADDLNAALTWLTSQNSTPGSPFTGKVDTGRLGLSGHSMGGGAALLAASRNTAVRSVTTLAAAETNPSAITASRSLATAVQYVGGSDDGIASVAEHQRKMYDAKSAPTQLRVITGGFHCGFEDTGGLGCDTGNLSRPAQLALTRKVTTAWLLYSLADETRLYDQVWGTAAQNDPAVVYTAKP